MGFLAPPLVESYVERTLVVEIKLFVCLFICLFYIVRPSHGWMDDDIHSFVIGLGFVGPSDAGLGRS